MPNGHDYSRKYGGHKYPEEGHTSMRDCNHRCGCYVAASTSGGPLGLDPYGDCPNNPESGERLPLDADYKIVVTRRISKGEAAIGRLARLSRPKKKLGEELDQAQRELSWYKNFVYQLRQSLSREPGQEKPT